MPVLSKLKQFKDLRQQGKKMQNAMADQSITTNKGGVALTMDGNLKIAGLAIDDDLMNVSSKAKLQENIKDAHDEALKKMQRVMASKMQEMGGFNMPGIK
ncbi:MAG: YbaB/EbfC family nucleoid-associated protein [bacterium]